MTTAPTINNARRRTRLLTAAGIAAVTLAAAFAISANIGILNATTSNAVGSLTAADLSLPATHVVDVQLDGSSNPTVNPLPAPTVDATVPETAQPQVQEFAVDTAGTVGVVAGKGTIRLDLVTPVTGWTWKLAQATPSSLAVTLRNATRTLVFSATAKPDGTVDANVSEPTVGATPAPRPARTARPSTPTTQSNGTHEYEGGGDDD